jgi:hypothetical protein
MKVFILLAFVLHIAAIAVSRSVYERPNPFNNEKRQVCSCSGMLTIPGSTAVGSIGVAYESPDGVSCYPPSWCMPGTGFMWMVIIVGNETIAGPPSTYALSAVCGTCYYT